MKSVQLSEMLRLAEVAFAAEQSKLAKLTRQEAGLRQQLASLVTSREEQFEQTKEHVTPAVRAGAGVRWHRWIDTRRDSLNRELAQILARRAQTVTTVRLAFGKKEALAALLARARAEELQHKNRKRDYTS